MTLNVAQLLSNRLWGNPSHLYSLQSVRQNAVNFGEGQFSGESLLDVRSQNGNVRLL